MNAHANLDPSKILGAVIDPKTGSYDALQIDIAKSLGIPPSAVAFCKPRIHQTRFVDIVDVIEARAKTPKRGRPKDLDRRTAA
jgi:hypothetical protein